MKKPKPISLTSIDRKLKARKPVTWTTEEMKLARENALVWADIAMSAVVKKIKQSTQVMGLRDALEESKERLLAAGKEDAANELRGVLYVHFPL